MLEIIRRNVRHPYIQALLGIVILVFIFFFGWGMQSQKPSFLAEVNGDVIEFRTYERAYNNLVQFYQDTFRENLTPERMKQLDLGRRALDQLVDQTLLMQEARYRDLSVSDAELQMAIESSESFRPGGQFSRDAYLNLLEANRITPLEYETSQRRQLLLDKVEQSIRAETGVSEEEVEQEYGERNTKLELAFVVVRSNLLVPDVVVAEEALADYYEAEKESFRTVEKRVGRYLLLPAEKFTDAVPVSDEEMREEFNWRASEFAVPEAVRARHILIQVAPDAGAEALEAARKKAEDLKSQLEGGADFGELAKKQSADPGSKDQGGDLGFFERGKMVPEFETAAFSLEPGSVSAPVKTSFGYHLIQVEERREASAPEFEAVRDRIEQDIRHRKALEQAYAAADNILMDLEDGATSWDQLGSEYEVLLTPAVDTAGTVPGVEKSEEFITALFGMSPEKPGELLETRAGTYLISVAEVLPASVPPLADVRSEVEAKYRQAESKRLAKKRADELVASAQADGWDEAVKTAGFTAERTGMFAKKGGAVPKLGWAPEVKEAAFAASELPALLDRPFEINENFYVLQVVGREDPDLAALTAADRASLRAELLPKKQNEHFQSYVEELRKRAEIEINEDLIL